MIGLLLWLSLLLTDKPSQRYEISKGPLDRASNVHREGRLWMYFNNYGKLYAPNFNMHSGEWPAGTNHEYIYRMAPVIGVPYNVVHSLTRTSEEFEAVGGLNSGLGLIAMSNDTATWPSSGWPKKDSLGNPIIKTPEDSYCAFSDSNNLITPLNLIVYQTGHAFGFSYAQDIVFFEWEIVNFGLDTLKDVYFTLYCDIDVGNTPGGDPEYGDDKVVFDRSENCLYFYDADGFSSDWNSPTGYFGVKVLETPKVNSQELGITDFHYFLYDDDPFTIVGLDTIQYKIMSSDSTLKSDPFWGPRLFHGTDIHYDDHTLIPARGMDLVAIVSSGPFTLVPHIPQKIVIAVCAGENEAAILKNMKTAENIYKNDFVTAVSPPRPLLNAIAGDRGVTLIWDNQAEDFIDPFSGRRDFEGYRVWKSKDRGLNWELLADYDIINNFETHNFVIVKHLTPELAGTDITFVGFASGYEGFFKNNTYQVVFHNDRLFSVYVKETGEKLTFNPELRDGFAVLDPSGTRVLDSLYTSGNIIYLPGVFIRITTLGAPPSAGDLYEVKTVKVDPGKNTGLVHTYIDTNVVNGFEYWYAVTSYDIGDPSIPIEPLESPKTGGTSAPNVISVIPGSLPLGYSSARVSKIVHLSGSSSLTPEVNVVDVNFERADTVIITFEPGIFSEFGITSDAVSLEIVDSGLVKSSIYRFYVDQSGYLDLKLLDEDSLLIRRLHIGNNDSITFDGYKITFFEVDKLKGKAFNVMFYAKLDNGDTTIKFPLFPGIWSPVFCGITFRFIQIKQSSYLGLEDSYQVVIEPYNVTTTSEMLSKIKVVPNPFIVKADWDTPTPQGLVKHKIQFINLPPRCEIRIYTIDGDLVKTLHHTSGTGYEDWDLTNEYGSYIAPGIYIYHVKSQWGEKTGRLGVVR
uniref:T9SS type A sorting domain-containing protein n=1 Tax=candidate division WOR-3 bacterium TaxID=2052148 RepID=A0A7V3ZXL4_UNCW3